MQITRTLLASLALSLLPGLAAAQLCPSGTDTFYKNDILPDVPGGTFSFSVIPGLCEGEACGSVFDALSGPVTLTQVACPFGSGGGAMGASASVNVQIYDGVSFDPSGIPNMGTLVWDMNAATGTSMQVTSSAINTLDVSQYGIVVGNLGTKFAVTFTMNVNPWGNCTTGFTSNFFTDNTQGGLFGCDLSITLPERNLIYILGQGWRDVTKATVTGIPLCPLYLAGNWAIRACSSSNANPLQVSVLGSPIPVGGSASVQFNGPGYENDFYIGLASYTDTPGTPLPPWGTLPLTNDSLMQITLSGGAGVFLNFFGTLSPTGQAFGTILVPPLAVLSGTNFYVGFVAIPASGTGAWGLSDSTPVSIQ